MSQDENFWAWIETPVLLAVHDEQLSEHGGASGIRDIGLFESAIARPQNLAIYETPDFAEIAAAYGFGIARNHPFIDGNKRTAFVAVELFLILNSYELQASDVDCVITMLAVAAGEMEEADFALWIRSNSTLRK